MPPSTRRKTLFLLPSIVLLSLFASSSLAIDLSRFKRTNDDAAALVPMSTEEALSHAKKIVNDMNDAATGTVTSYQPGREKEPVTCNEIMAKSVVVANEEKAVITAEKDAVVRAATLLSEKIDQMEKELNEKVEEVTTLEHALGVVIEDHDADLQAASDEADREKEEASNVLAGVVENHEAEMKKTQEDHEQQLKEVMDEAAKNSSDAQATVLAEQEKSRINMDALKNATAASIAKIEKDHTEEMTKADVVHAEKMAAAEQKIESIQADASRSISESQQTADDLVASIEEKSASDWANLQEATQKRISEVEMEAKQTVENMEIARLNIEDEHQRQITELSASHEEKMKLKEEQIAKRAQEMQDALDKVIKQGEDMVRETKALAEERIGKMKDEMKTALAHKDDEIKETEAKMERVVNGIQGEMEKALAKASDHLSVQTEENKRLESELQEKVDEANKKERSLSGDIKLLRSSSFKLQDEVSLWKEVHGSQGYCNTTLIKADSQQFVMDAWGNTSRGLQSGQKALAAAMGAQLEVAQQAYGDVMLYIEKEVIPKIEKIVGDARDKAIALYDEHLAEPVNQNLAPVYNDHIRPVYEQHVSPVVQTVKGEAGIVYEKSQKEVQKARSGAAQLVRQSSSAALLAVEEKEIDSMLPGWIMLPLSHSSKDGEWAVDKLSRGLLILTIILCRGLIWRMIGAMFSLVWFFCPLRLFVGGRRKTVENEAQQGTKKVKKIEIKKVE